jgi:hypothetical protein
VYFNGFSLRFGACLSARLVLQGRWGDLGAYARELSRLKGKEQLRLPPQLPTLKLYRLCRPAQKYKVVYILAIWYDFEAKKRDKIPG